LLVAGIAALTATNKVFNSPLATDGTSVLAVLIIERLKPRAVGVILAAFALVGSINSINLAT
jgi:UDP-N-acetylmuramyl pentapeptide phosphotransferase/UDP-N-acetylglucosamine-1-phosphate transferase